MFQLFKRFRKSEKGQGMVEYGLILALVSVVAIGSLGGIGGKLNDTFDKVVGVVSGGEVIPNVSEEPIYTDEEVQDLVDNQGYTKVATADDLNDVRNNSSGKYIQVADINLSEITNFEPIGKTNNEFKGTFDGGGYVISNLTINRGSEDFVGLFGRVEGATLTNIGLVNVNVSGGGHVGGLVGWQDGSSVSDSYATGSVKGSYDVGGLVGWQGTSSEVLNSYATVTVTGNSQIGGLVGNQQSSSKVLNSYAMGSVTGGGSFTANTGGLVGYQQSSSTVTNSYATGSVNSGSRSNIGGLVGHNNGSSTVRNSYYDRNTTGQSDAGKGTGKSTDEMKKKATYTGWDSDTVWQIIDGQYPTLR